MYRRLNFVFWAFFLLPICGVAQVYKCGDGVGGAVNFSDQPCVPGQKSSEVKIYKDAPATTPALSDGRAEAARERQKEQAAYDARMKAISDARTEVRRIKSENYDPGKCAEVRQRMADMKKRDPIGFSFNLDYMEFQQKEALYCGN